MDIQHFFGDISKNTQNENTIKIDKKGIIDLDYSKYSDIDVFVFQQEITIM